MDYYDYNADVKKTSVKVHHRPGGQSNFSLSHDEGPKNYDKFSNKNPTNFQSMMQPVPDDTYFKKTYQNKSQLDFSDNSQNEDPRYPRKTQPPNQEQKI